MIVYARINHIGWIHLWRSREEFETGAASAHFLNPRTDPRWLEAALSESERRRLEARELVEIVDPGYFSDEDSGTGS